MSHVGRHIGRYRILEELGSGGMSIVYKGLDTALDREVAVKVLHPHLAGKEESRMRLAREAKAVAKLHHPNILEVFDFAAVGAEDAFIVTEYIRGQTLRAYASKEGFDPPEIAAMVIHGVAAALGHAHEAGVIHRDLKPENVMVRDDGVLKLMDFGIAKILDRDDRMTMTGALVGSPAHMAPEIIEGEDAGPEADVFSLGTMLYLFAVGRLPFAGTNTTATLRKILDGTYEDPRQIVPTVSDELAEIIATCLARSPAARYPNAGRLRDALGDYLAAVGFTRIDEELAAFFADPPSYRKQMVKRLTEQLVSRGEVFLKDKRPAKALSSLNQVLALDPSHERALLLLKQMNLSRQRARRKWRGLGLLAGVALVAVASSAGVRLYRSRQTAPPPAARPRVAALPTPLAAEPAHEEPNAPATLVPEAANAPASKVAVRPQPRSAIDKMPVTIQIRPYGAVHVDTGESSLEPRARHTLKLSAGPRIFTVTCDGCSPTEETIQVPPPNGTIYLLAKPLPSFLSFKVEPPDATVKVHTADARAQPVAATAIANDTVLAPIKLEAHPGDPIGYSVRYEISKPGFVTYASSEPERLAPGQRQTIVRRLERR